MFSITHSFCCVFYVCRAGGEHYWNGAGHLLRSQTGHNCLWNWRMNSFWAYDFLFFLDLSPARVSHAITQQFSPFGEILWAEQKTINQSMLISLYHLVSELLCVLMPSPLCASDSAPGSFIVRTMPSCGLISLLSDWKTLSQTLNSPHKRLLFRWLLHI